jgi:hypothetical protein
VYEKGKRKKKLKTMRGKGYKEEREKEVIQHQG